MMVLRVRLEMLSELFDARREQRNLDFRRAAIVSGSCIVADNCSLASGLKGHQVFYSFPFLLFDNNITDHNSRVKCAATVL